jgi:general secretion pathway protein K
MRRRRHPSRDRERGIVLLMVLFALALIGAAAVAISLTGRGETKAARNAADAATARNAAEAGVQIGLRHLLARAATNDLAMPPAESVQIGGAAVGISVADEEGKLDLNEAPLELIAGALFGAGVPPEQATPLACRLIARRGYADGRCEPTEMPETGLFKSAEEIYHLGVGEPVFWKVLPVVTVYSGSSAIDPRVAPPGALAAVPSMTPEDVDAFVQRRAAAAESRVPLDDSEVPRDRRWFAVSTRQTYAISASATTATGARSRAEMVVRLTGQPRHPFVVLAWRQPRG